MSNHIFTRFPDFKNSALSPSKVLIPLCYTSILAGTCTLIGTSTNIIISDLNANNGYGAIGMFELSMLGLAIAAIGIAFLLAAAPRFIPELLNPSYKLENSEHRRYLPEFAIPHGRPPFSDRHFHRHGDCGRSQTFCNGRMFWGQCLLCDTHWLPDKPFVYGPGGYRFSDYLKLGIPLNLLVLILGCAFIPILWPF